MKEEEKDVGGRPPFYKTAQELKDKIDSYFKKGVKIRKVIIGKKPNQQVVEVPVPTISGLAKFLGFESRQSFYDYEKKDGFTYTVKRARLFIETEYEEQLQTGSVAGAIFALKNMGWTDRTEMDLNDDRQITKEDRIARIAALKQKLDNDANSNNQ